MAEPGSEATVPVWVVNLTSEMSAIRAKVEAIPKITQDLEALRANSVPLSEHQFVMTRVNAMWDIINADKPGVDLMRSRFDTLWSEREQVRGAMFATRLGLAVLTVADVALGVYLALRQLHLF